MPGIIIYSGPSSYDGSPIISVLIKGSTNRKTGATVQQYIIREDVHPVTASRRGLDFSVCGNCKHKGTASPDKVKGEAIGRTCYVKLHHGPRAVHDAYKRGRYPVARTVEDVQKFIDGGIVRLGAYGDPACLPNGLNDTLISLAGAHTSYTHGYTVGGTLGNNAARYSMVSADSIDEAIKAHNSGFRTFRVVPIRDANKPLLKNEIVCPGDGGVKCIDCRLCNGAMGRGKSIAIIAHGVMKNKI